MSVPDLTNSRVAALASQGLFDPATLTLDEMRAICAAALMRVPDHRQQEVVQSRPLYEQIDVALAAMRREQEPNDQVTRPALGLSPT
jgi:hypothetical protein